MESVYSLVPFTEESRFVRMSCLRWEVMLQRALLHFRQTHSDRYLHSQKCGWGVIPIKCELISITISKRQSHIQQTHQIR